METPLAQSMQESAQQQATTPATTPATIPATTPQQQQPEPSCCEVLHARLLQENCDLKAQIEIRDGNIAGLVKNVESALLVENKLLTENSALKTFIKAQIEIRDQKIASLQKNVASALLVENLNLKAQIASLKKGNGASVAKKPRAVVHAYGKVAQASASAAKRRKIGETMNQAEPKATQPEAADDRKQAATTTKKVNQQEKMFAEILETQQSIIMAADEGATDISKKRKRKKYPRRVPSPNKTEINWNRNFDELVAYKEKFGHCNVSISAGVYKKLGMWCDHQRNCHKRMLLTGEPKGILSDPERIRRLLSVGFSFVKQRAPGNNQFPFEARFRQLVEYKAKKGHCNVSIAESSHEDDEWPKGLGHFVAEQRKYYNRLQDPEGGNKKNSLNQERVDQLNSIGFQWSLRECQKKQQVEDPYDEEGLDGTYF